MSLAGPKMLAVAASLLVHGALATTLLDAAQPIETEGGGGASEASLGSSFADMAVGTMNAETVTDTATPAPPTATEATTSDTAPTRVEPTQPAEVADTPSADAVPPSNETTPRDEPLEMAALPPDEAPGAERTEAARPDPATVEAEPASPASASEAAPVATAEAPNAPTVPAPETLTPEESEPGRVRTSPRPSARTAEFEERHRRPAPPQQTRTAERTEPRQEAPSRGNNESVTARAGSTTGRETAAPSQTSRGGGASNEAGNAAASNYSGLVMRQLSRVARPRVGSRGTATVEFSIASNGNLAGLGLVRSSGSPALDNAAMQIVRRAAPFPQPPRGARTSYQISIEGQ